MAQVLKARRLVNPGRVKRRLSLKQKLHFGSARQRAAAKVALKNPRKRIKASRASGMNRKVRKAKSSAQANYYKKKHNTRINKRYSNVGEIITIRPLSSLLNPGTRKRRRKSAVKKGSNSNIMAKRRRSTRRRNSGTRVGRSWSSYSTKRRRKNPGVRRVHRRRSGVVVRRRRRRSNPGVVVRYRNRGSVRRRRVGRRRSNPGFLSGGTGTFTTAVGVISGAMVTSFVTNMLPSSMNQGITGYIATAIVANLQGMAVGKILKNPTLGKNMTIGGYVYLSLKLANDFLPNLAGSFGIGLRGLGIIGPSNFWTPQVPNAGNFGQFQQPAALTAATMAMSAPSGMAGLNTRRGARMR